MSSRSFEETHEKFFEYYDNLQLVKTLTPEEFSIIEDKGDNFNMRGEIVTLLSKGIESTTPISNIKGKLHVLSANEIQTEIQILHNKKITLSNVYFHLQKLEDYGLVQIVDSLPSGRRFTAYYGRTARVFMLETDVTEAVIEPILTNDTNKEFIESLTKFSKSISNKSNSEVDAIFSETLSVNKHFIETDNDYRIQFETWIHKYEKEIRESDLDLIQFYFVYIKLIDYQSRLVKSFRAFKDLLDMPDIEAFSS